ncbi:hypothetical protein Smp_01 [Stenotrophomonas phage Smp131]|uniref:Uncharacterized protein n=1 Tax=Stenotrophomonas phage Smp131 TaxID=1168563 RepID=V9IQW2_9CAUD|nr:hypothetical protein CH36_gp01 [Stenotrophomonas phage Smp131]AFJ75471.1 hypothetical protein Smp_01 [Stenotrophomonas phage Smp131]
MRAHRVRAQQVTGRPCDVQSVNQQATGSHAPLSPRAASTICHCRAGGVDDLLGIGSQGNQRFAGKGASLRVVAAHLCERAVHCVLE